MQKQVLVIFIVCAILIAFGQCDGEDNNTLGREKRRGGGRGGVGRGGWGGGYRGGWGGRYRGGWGGGYRGGWGGRYRGGWGGRSYYYGHYYADPCWYDGIFYTYCPVYYV